MPLVSISPWNRSQDLRRSQHSEDHGHSLPSGPQRTEQRSSPHTLHQNIMAKENVAHIYNELLFSLLKGGNSAVRDNTDEP